ncbi:thioredoxin domain-containing protein [Frankia sp. R43]|uniref:DsbA family protein n=1 Tax=Frankia sp. R43 TaxID=269536 RepID=UPI0009F8FE59|nr:thioredoxin domain-containing protein [Frankia sp. R43]
MAGSDPAGDGPAGKRPANDGPAGKRPASVSAAERRERVAAARRAEAAKERRRRQLIIGSVVAGLLVLAAVIGFAIQSSREESKPVVLPSTATGPDNSIVVGQASAPVTVDIYEDFQCPACGQLEKTTGSTISDLIDAGDIKVNYHLMSFLGPESVRAANAASAAADENKFKPFHDALFADQPTEHTDGYQNDTLIEKGASVGLTSTAFVDAVRNGKFDGYVAKVDESASKAGVTSTPTVLVDSKQLSADQLTPDGLKAAVAAAKKNG